MPPATSKPSGARSPGFSPGERVYIYGTSGGPIVGAYAELAVCTAPQVHRLPARASFAQGAAIGVPYATAYRALFHRAQAQPAETVLVHGATGGVGLAVVQLAHAHGMTVIGTGGTDRGLDIVRDRVRISPSTIARRTTPTRSCARPAGAASTSSSKWPRT